MKYTCRIKGIGDWDTKVGTASDWRLWSFQSTHFAPRNAYEWDAHTGDVVTFGLPAWVWRCTLSKQMPDTCEPGLQRHRWVWSIYITRCMHPICCTRTLQTHSIAESLLLYRRGVGQLRVQFLSLPKRSVALVTTTRKGGRQSSYNPREDEDLTRGPHKRMRISHADLTRGPHKRMRTSQDTT